MWRWFKMRVLGLPDYEGFARGVARIKENCERDGIDFAPLAQIAEDIVNQSRKR
jgi:hypothetical protein